MITKLQRTARFYFLRFKRLQGDPRSLAIGVAIGVFIGISPTLPLHTVMIVAVTLLLRVSTVSAIIAAAVVSNPLTFALQYFLCWKVGNILLPDRLTWDKMREILNIVMNQGFSESLESISRLSVDAIFVMLTGGILLGLPLAFISYILSLNFFLKIHEKRRKKHLLN